MPIPVAPRPSLDQYRKRAKGLVKAARSGDRRSVRAWAADWMAALAAVQSAGAAPDVRGWLDDQVDRLEALAWNAVSKAGARRAPYALADAQFVVARAHGFESWSHFANYVAVVSGADSPVSQLDATLEAVTAAARTRLPEGAARDALIAGILSFLEGQDLLTLDDIRTALQREIDEAGPKALLELRERLADADPAWAYSPMDPLARRIHQVLAHRLLQRDSALIGIEHAAAVAGRPVVMVANHLSYADANLVQILLHQTGADALAERLTIIAGPKIFSRRTRRFSSLCFGTIRTPQSSGVATGEAAMGARDVARAARASLTAAQERLARGDALLVFGEGTRSRTHGMQAMLPGVTRYFDAPGAVVLPVGITGTEALFPIGDERLHPVRIVVHVGRPLDAEALRSSAGGNRRAIIDAVGLAIAGLLPAEYRGVYADGTPPRLTT